MRVMVNNDVLLFSETNQETPFVVTPSKIKMQTSQYRKFRIWEVKEDKCKKSLAKNQVYVIFICEIFGKRPLKIVRLCMETPCLCPFEGYKYGSRKPTGTSVFEFSFLCVNSLLEQLINS